MRHWILLILLVLWVAALAGCGSEPKRVPSEIVQGTVAGETIPPECGEQAFCSDGNF